MATEVVPRDMKVEISTDGTTWTDISGEANHVSVSGGDWQTGKFYVFGDATPRRVKSVKDVLTVTVRILYAEDAGAAWDTIRQVHEAGSDLWVRWSPKGGNTGDFLFEARGTVKTFPWPGGEPDQTAPILAEFQVEASEVTKSVVA